MHGGRPAVLQSSSCVPPSAGRCANASCTTPVLPKRTSASPTYGSASLDGMGRRAPFTVGVKDAVNETRQIVPAALLPLCRAVHQALADGVSAFSDGLFAVLSPALHAGLRLSRGPFFCEMDGPWRAVIRQAARQVPKGEPIRVRVDETVCKKSGDQTDTFINIEPAGTYRNGAGTPRQEYRTLWEFALCSGRFACRFPVGKGTPCRYQSEPDAAAAARADHRRP